MEQESTPTFKQTYEKVTTSKIFNQFKEQHPDAKLCAGFFILDFLSNDTKKSLDYLDKDSDKVFTFNLDDNNEITLKQDKLLEQSDSPQKLTPIEPTPKAEINELKEIIEKKKAEENISAKLHKIIAVLQNYENNLTWNLTCMLDQLIILHVLINAETKEIIKFERKNMMDFIKKR